MDNGQGQLILQSGLPNSGSKNGVLLSVNVQKMGFTSPVFRGTIASLFC